MRSAAATFWGMHFKKDAFRETVGLWLRLRVQPTEATAGHAVTRTMKSAAERTYPGAVRMDELCISASARSTDCQDPGVIMIS